MTIHPFTPMFGAALEFAFRQATTEGKVTIGILTVVSLFSWTVIISKVRQLTRARSVAKKFFARYRASRDPLEIFAKKEEFEGAPAYEVYYAGAHELAYQIEHNPIMVKGKTRISSASFDSVRVALERTVSAEALSLEKGMIVLSTAVAGGPFIGLLGTVWGVMETFAGIARAHTASLTAMAPGVAGALIAAVVGLLVAIPAMFAFNFMVTTIRAITQELDNFTSELATAIEHGSVDNRALADEIAAAIRANRVADKASSESEPDSVLA